MMRHPLPISFLLLLLPFNAAAETTVITGTDVKCSWSHNVVQNPSFELGSLSPWAVYNNYGTVSIAADSSDAGQYVASMAPNTSGFRVLYQSLTDLVVGETYTLSFDYKLVAVNAGYCALYFSIDGITADNRITTTAMAYVRYSGSSSTPYSTAWNTLSTTYAPTSTSLDLYILVVCDGNSRIPQAAPQLSLDNVQFSNDNVEIETCTKSTYTSTVTMASSSTPVNTPIASASSSVAIPSAVASSQIPSSTPAASPSRAVPSSSVSSLTRQLSSAHAVSSLASPLHLSSTVLSQSHVSASSPTKTTTVPTRKPLSSISRIAMQRPSSTPLSSMNSLTSSSLSAPSLSGQTSVPSFVFTAQSGSPVSTRTPLPSTSGISRSQSLDSSSSAPTSPKSTSLSIKDPLPSTSSHDTSSVYGTPSALSTIIATTTVSSKADVNNISGPSSLPAAAEFPKSSTANTLGSTTGTVGIIESSSGSTAEIQTLPTTTPSTPGTQPANDSDASTPSFTTSTIFSTRTTTITACPSSVLDCPASSKTTSITTETIIVSTTICPVTATEVATTATSVPSTEAAGNLFVSESLTVSQYGITIASSLPSASNITDSVGTDIVMYTTSTVFSTRTATIVACPSNVLDCPASSKTPSMTTETILLSTTICPITATASVMTEQSPTTGAMTTESLLTTVTKTITGCPSTVTDCPASQKHTYTTTETLVAGTTAYSVPLAEGSSSTGSSAVSTKTITLIPISNVRNVVTESAVAGPSEPTAFAPSNPSSVHVSSTASETPALASTAMKASTPLSSVDVNVDLDADALAQATESPYLKAADISDFVLPTTSALIHDGPAGSTPTFIHLLPSVAGSSTLTSQKNSATVLSTSTRTYNTVASTSTVVYTGSASVLRSKWLKFVGGFSLFFSYKLI